MVNGKTMKKKGGTFDRLSGSNTKTYCCNNKSSSMSVLGGDNVGKDCNASRTGMCYDPRQSKFRCFDSKGEPHLDEIKEGRDEKGNRYEGSCQHISSLLSKGVRTVAAPVKAVGTVMYHAPGIMLAAGGKKRRSKKTKKNTRRNNRKSRRQRRSSSK